MEKELSKLAVDMKNFHNKSDQFYWNLIDYLGWDSEYTDHDYKRIGGRLGGILSASDIMDFEMFVKQKKNELKSILELYALVYNGDRHGYYGVSDDGFWDLTAHIVGSGKEVYDKICKNPKAARSVKYVENFQYIFKYTGHNDENSLYNLQINAE